MTNKIFLNLKDISSADFQRIIEDSIADKNGSAPLEKVLKDKHIGLLFEKPSTRTNVSFQVAISSLGGHCIQLPFANLQLSRGEHIRETALVLAGYLDGLVIRSRSHAVLEEISQSISMPIINALSDKYHPCQALADVMTIAEEGFDLKETKVCFIGDGDNNVCYSLAMASIYAGFEFRIVSPLKYKPDSSIIDDCRRQGAKITLYEGMEEALEDADVLYTDVWISMGKENEIAQRKKDLLVYQINDSVLDKTAKHTILMHCMPARMEEEITKSAFYSSKSRIIKQAHNKLHTAKALLHYLYS